MTRNEFIRNVKGLTFRYPIMEFELMKSWASQFDSELMDFFDGYMTENQAINYVYRRGNINGLAEMYRCLECVEFNGVYTTDCDDYLVDVDLPRLRDDLINRLLLYEDDGAIEPIEEDTAEEAVWVDEDDDFLTKESKQ